MSIHSVLGAILLFLSPAFAEEGKILDVKPCPTGHCISSANEAPIPLKGIGIRLEGGNREHPNKHKCFGGGILVGIPTKGSIRGLIFKTMEMQILVGKFPGNEKYVGHSFDVSTDDPHVFALFNKVAETGKAYIFEYKVKHPLNPEIEDSHYQITAIHPILSDNIDTCGIEKSVVAETVRTGRYSEGQREGRIVSVDRWGKNQLSQSICTIELEQGGLNTQGEKAVANIENFVVYGEHACRWAEAMLQLPDVEVTLEYRQDFFEAWHYYDRYVTKMAVRKPVQDIPQNVSSVKLDEATLETIKNALLNDPEFLKSVRSKID